MTAFEIRPLATRAEFEACVHLQESTWGLGFSERVPVAILQTVQRLGGIASGAFSTDGSLAGFIFGITGWRDGRPIHWSDMMAVRPDARDHGLGERLKWHQRNLLLDQDMETVEWTFEPLEARNAHLNINRLGARAVRYVRDYYGDSDSVLHTGLGTDRLVLEWSLRSDAVASRADGSYHTVGPEDTADIPLINDVRTEDGIAATGAARTDMEAGRLRLAIPGSIQDIRSDRPELAVEWRKATRDAFEAYLPRGYAITALVRYGRWSAYLLDLSHPDDDATRAAGRRDAAPR